VCKATPAVPTIKIMARLAELLGDAEKFARISRWTDVHLTVRDERPFNSPGSSGALEEWHGRNGVDDRVLLLDWRAAGGTIFKIAVCQSYANLQEQICAPL
jgi:hypothetical protein